MQGKAISEQQFQSKVKALGQNFEQLKIIQIAFKTTLEKIESLEKINKDQAA